MRVLVLNAGSSSLKYRIIDMDSERELLGGEAQRIGPPTAKPSRIVHRCMGAEEIHEIPMRNIPEAFGQVSLLMEKHPECRPDAVGHRVVHGGELFRRPTLIDAEVVRQLEGISNLAPLHNPPALGLIKACRERFPDLPQVAVFDTAFHATIPDYAYTYALPEEMRTDMGIRKYGFHGTSHEYIAEEAARFLGIPLEQLNAVSCHLGSGGASLCAIVGGNSVDNTMGYSPLQGLMMSTRCGDLDPGVVLRLLNVREGDSQAVKDELNKNSGVLGMSGVSAEIRDVLKRADESPQMSTTAQVYLWRIRKYLGAYLAVVGSPHAVIFTDTIGETVPAVRWSVCADMSTFGVEIDWKKNESLASLPADVATDRSPVRILVIATNEELAIARRTRAALTETACLS